MVSSIRFFSPFAGRFNDNDQTMQFPGSLEFFVKIETGSLFGVVISIVVTVSLKYN